MAAQYIAMRVILEMYLGTERTTVSWATMRWWEQGVSILQGIGEGSRVIKVYIGRRGEWMIGKCTNDYKLSINKVHIPATL